MNETISKITNKEDATLHSELKALRDALKRTSESIQTVQDDAALVKLGGLLTKLCDSIARIKLAEQKLAPGNEGAEWLRAEFKSVLDALWRRKKAMERPGSAATDE